MEQVTDRFLRYVAIDTQSQHDIEVVPSTEKQKTLAILLVEELQQLGIRAETDEHGYVYGFIPANNGKNSPVLGFIAHMDTSPDLSGENVKPRIVKNYDGGDIVLNEPLGYLLSPNEFDSLAHYVGQDLIVTDGTTLLGGDDKAGIAEIMALCEYIVRHPEFKHGALRIGFTPDEEVGNGPAFFDVKKFGADFAYTVDGGEAGELEYENFNGASLQVTVTGKNIHPGSAKNKLVNAQLIAMEYNGMLPPAEIPAHTAGYEGFFHLTDMQGEVEHATLSYIIRDHDLQKFEHRKETAQKIGDYLNQKYGAGTVLVETKDRYFNMKQQILPHMHLIDNAKKAMEQAGIAPKVIPIRGGTDGARLSFMGLPCPNLGTGDHNAHGRFEYVSVSGMEACVEILKNLTAIYADIEK